MNGWMRAAAVLAVAATAVATGSAASAGPGGEPSGTTVDSFRYHEASVFVDGGPEGFMGAVGFRSVVKGEAGVDVFLSSEQPVTCSDGSEDARNETLRPQDRSASQPGPVELEVAPRLQEARGEGVVDLVHSVAPGCGADEVSTVLVAQPISVQFTGTTELIRARMGGSASAGSVFDRARVTSIARDGTGHAAVGTLVDADSDASWLKYAVEHFARRGSQPEIAENPAPEGGIGALGAASAGYEPDEGLGVLFDDAIVAATVGPAPDKEMAVSASAVGVTAVRCASGEIGYRYRDAYGDVVAPVTIGRRLASAHAEGTAQLTEVLYDECTGMETSRIVSVPVALELAATGPAVRVRDTSFFNAPPQPVTRLNGWSLRRPATGMVTVGAFTAPTDLGAISRASR